jgi:hypothetical protein
MPQELSFKDSSFLDAKMAATVGNDELVHWLRVPSAVMSEGESPRAVLLAGDYPPVSLCFSITF